jgi:hypothetical protein
MPNQSMSVIANAPLRDPHEPVVPDAPYSPFIDRAETAFAALELRVTNLEERFNLSQQPASVPEVPEPPLLVDPTPLEPIPIAEPVQEQPSKSITAEE